MVPNGYGLSCRGPVSIDNPLWITALDRAEESAALFMDGETTAQRHRSWDFLAQRGLIAVTVHALAHRGRGVRGRGADRHALRPAPLDTPTEIRCHRPRSAFLRSGRRTILRYDACPSEELVQRILYSLPVAWGRPQATGSEYKMIHNPKERIAEATMNWWLGEAQGLQVGLAEATKKIVGLDRRLERNRAGHGKGIVSLGMPVIDTPR